MKSGKFWLAVLVAGIVVNILDAIVMGGLFKSTMEGIESMRPDMHNQVPWFIVGDFLFVLVLAWFYDRAYGSFSGGAKGGATFGLYAGVICNFPLWLFLHLMFKGFPYGFSWMMTVYGILWGVIAGAVLGALYKKPMAA